MLPGTPARKPEDSAASGWPHPEGPWLGQAPPGREPALFAPGLVSTGLNERDVLFSADGRTLWFGVMAQGLVTILETRLEAGRWTEPSTVPFHTDPEFACFEATLAADGTLYFSREDTGGHPAIWSAEPNATGYDEPVKLGGEVNVGTDNYNATVAPDESWLILCVGGHPQNVGAADYWISFRDSSGSWQPAVPMGDRFNGPDQRAASASVSPAGKFLFFSSNRTRLEEYFPAGRLTRRGLLALHAGPGGGGTDIYWVDARVLDEYR